MNSKIKSLIFSLLILMGGGAILSACHTVHGAGEDIERSSDAVKKAL